MCNIGQKITMSPKIAYLLGVLVILFGAKIISILFTFALLSAGIVYVPNPHEPLQSFSHLTNAIGYKWDSEHYVNIAFFGYRTDGDISANVAFPYFYPLLIRMASVITGDYIVSAILLSNIFYFLSVVAFYFVANESFKNPKMSAL